MFFLQSVQAPFLLGLLGKDNKPEYFIEVPRYTLEQAIAYGAELSERWRQEQTANMTPNEVHNFNIMHPPFPLSPADLKQHVQSMPGAREVIQRTMPNATVYRAKATDTIEVRKDERGKDRKFRHSEWSKGEVCTSPELLAELTQRILNGNGSSRLSQIAYEIADLYDLAPRAPITEEEIEERKEQQREQEESGKDPLPSTAKQG